MLLTERQRLVANAGLLTLLGWMAVTIAFNKTPSASNGAWAPAPSPAKRIGDSAIPAASPANVRTDATSSLPPAFSVLSGLVKEPTVKLPTAPRTLPSGTVIRMGEGVQEQPDLQHPDPYPARTPPRATSRGPVP